MSDSDSSSESSESDNTSKMTELKDRNSVNRSKHQSDGETSSSESSDDYVRQMKKQKEIKSEDHSDSDSSHIEPSQFRTPRDLKQRKITSGKSKSSKSQKKSNSKSHDISSSSEEEEEIKSSPKSKSPKKRKHSEDCDEQVTSKKRLSRSPQKLPKSGDRKSKKGTSSRQISKSTVLSSDSEDSTEKVLDRPQDTNQDVRSRVGSPISDVHSLTEADTDDYELWLIKVPAKVPLSALPKEVVMNGSQDFSISKKHYELVSFTDELVERDHVSFVQGHYSQLLEGPRVKGQMQIISRPSEPLRPVTRPLITHKPVPFPSGLKVRFTPFGADAPAGANIPPKHKKHKKKRLSENDDSTMESVEDTDGSPKKKKKKKKKT